MASDVTHMLWQQAAQTATCGHSGTGMDLAMVCPALSCTAGLDRGCPSVWRHRNRLDCASCPWPASAAVELLCTGESESLCCLIQQRICLGPAQPSTEGSDRRGTGDRVTQHEVGKDSLRPEKAMSRGLESFAKGSGQSQ